MGFSIKGAFANVAKGFETAWTDLKNGAQATETFLTNQEAAIEKDTAEVGAVVETALPGTTGVVSVIETLESKVLGIVIAGAGEIAGATTGNAVQTVTALKALLPQITALQGQLSTHPAVVAANK